MSKPDTNRLARADTGGPGTTAHGRNIERFTLGGPTYTLTDTEFNFYNGTAHRSMRLRGGLVAATATGVVGANSFFIRLDLKTWA